jgi:hypothetical protein
MELWDEPLFEENLNYELSRKRHKLAIMLFRKKEARELF